MVVALMSAVFASDEVGPVAGPAEWPVLFPGQCAPGDPHFDLEVLYYEGKHEEGLKLANERLAANPKDKDLHWMKVRFMYEIGEKSPRPHAAALAWYEEMVDTAEAGLLLAPGDPHLRFARGVAMGRLGTTRGVLSSLFMAKDVEEDWLSVANGSWRYASLGGNEVLPCDDFHALGIYYRLVPDWWIVQMIAGTRGDLDKSVLYNQKSIECKPNEVENWKELGATQLCIGERRSDAAMTEAGRASLRRATGLPVVTDRNRIDKEHSLMLLADPSLACEYSRDGQQDLDEKKLEKP